MRLAIVTTHPIQYYAPVFKLLHERGNIEICVFYTLGENYNKNTDRGFGKLIEWDLPLLDGYPYEWVENQSRNPGSHHFKGIVTPGLNAQIANWKPDALLIFGWAYQGHLKALRYFKNKIPVYFRGDSTLLDELAGIKSVLKTIWLRWIYKHIDHAFYTGSNNKAYFKKYGLAENQLTFAPHAIDNRRFAQADQAAAAQLRAALNISPGELLVVFAGKFEKKKSPELLLDAFIEINQPATHLLFAGSGALKEQLIEKAAQHNNIHFIDFQNQTQMPAAYQAADLFCLPSKGPGESWGLAVNEAMACGKAVLVSDKVGCAVDLVKNDYNGLIFPVGDVQALTNALRKLLVPDLLKKYGQNSAAKIANWNFEALAAAIENKVIYET